MIILYFKMRCMHNIGFLFQSKLHVNILFQRNQDSFDHILAYALLSDRADLDMSSAEDQARQSTHRLREPHQEVESEKHCIINCRLYSEIRGRYHYLLTKHLIKDTYCSSSCRDVPSAYMKTKRGLIGEGGDRSTGSPISYSIMQFT